MKGTTGLVYTQLSYSMNLIRDLIRKRAYQHWNYGLFPTADLERLFPLWSDIITLLTVDGEPSTIWRKGCPNLKYVTPLTLRAVQPNAKFLVIMRNPTER